MRCVENSEYLCSSTDNFRYVVEKIIICNVVYNKGDNIAYMKFYEKLERWSHLLRSKALYYELYPHFRHTFLGDPLPTKPVNIENPLVPEEMSVEPHLGQVTLFCTEGVGDG